jgi:anti-anti-sigma factor
MNHPSIVHIEDPLRTPLTGELRRKIDALLRRGNRNILLDLGDTDLDAAGIGELVRVFNLTRAAGGHLRVTCIRRSVRQLLEQVGLLHLLTDDAADPDASEDHLTSPEVYAAGAK